MESERIHVYVSQHTSDDKILSAEQLLTTSLCPTHACTTPQHKIQAASSGQCVKREDLPESRVSSLVMVATPHCHSNAFYNFHVLWDSVGGEDYSCNNLKS